MKFEFDPRKSASNKEKHGLDFIEAQVLWESWTLEIPAKNVDGRFRYAVLGEIGNMVYTAIITYGGGVIRIISVRRSSQPEILIYERKKAERR